MKSLAIYCVCYNSYSELDAYLQSVVIAADAAKEALAVTVFVADNSDHVQSVALLDSDTLTLVHFPTGRNAGYLGAVQDCMKQHSPHDFDFVIISNVDLRLSVDAFVNLLKISDLNGAGWLAPQIWSDVETRDRNPKIMERYGRRKLQFLLTLYQHPWLYRLYEHTAYRRKRVTVSGHREGKSIYAGHGSFMVFTRTFFDAVGHLDYPVFLFCEEIYLAELCRKHGLTVRYEPSVKVIDAEHCSTGQMKSRSYCRYNAEAVKYILETYYE